jgi:hypothetical protein
MKHPPFFCMKTLMGFGGQDLNRITLNCPDGSEFVLMELGEARTEKANYRANELATHLSALWAKTAPAPSPAL